MKHRKKREPIDPPLGFIRPKPVFDYRHREYEPSVELQEATIYSNKLNKAKDYAERIRQQRKVEGKPFGFPWTDQAHRRFSDV